MRKTKWLIGWTIVSLFYLAIGGGSILVSWLLIHSEMLDAAITGALKEGRKVLVVPDAPRLNPELEERLVYFTGAPAMKAPCVDPATGVTVDGLAFHRSVEMFQWKRRLRRNRYAWGAPPLLRVWSKELHHPSGLPEGERNPERFPIESATFYPTDLSVGELRLSPELLAKKKAEKDLPINPSVVPAVEKALGRSASLAEGGKVVAGKGTADAPEVGDLRFSYQYAPKPERISGFAKYRQGVLYPYETSNGQTIAVLRAGEDDPAELWRKEEQVRDGSLWFQRIFCYLALFVAIRILLRPATRYESVRRLVDKTGRWKVAALAAFALTLLSIAAGKLFA